MTRPPSGWLDLCDEGTDELDEAETFVLRR